jgi:hypothetical protein
LAQLARQRKRKNLSRRSRARRLSPRAKWGVKEGELEKEHGRVIWSFDIATPGSAEITEIHVNANTGEVIATEKETEAHEEKEKNGEK